MSENETNETQDQPTPPSVEAPASESTPPAMVDPASVSTDDKNMGMLAHLLGIVGFLGPLIIWLIKKDESAFVNQEGKESLNFQITMFIAFVVLGPISVCTAGIGAILYLPLFVIWIVFCIMGALKAKEGIGYRYPFALRFIK